MYKHLRYNYYFSRVVYVLIFIDIWYRTSDNRTNFILFTGIFLAISINDHLRIYGFYRIRNRYYISLFISGVLGAIVAYYVHGYIDVYIYFILYELILFNSGKIARIFSIVYILMMIGVIIFRQLPNFISFGKEDLFNIIIFLISIFTYIFALLAYKALNIEKRNVDQLNEELKKQSEEIEKLIVEKERNRVAQEIHDYLGHNLAALSMNLDVAGKIINQDYQKSEEIIKKCQWLTKESMKGLRQAVYALKEDDYSMGLKSSIEKLVQNVTVTGNIEVAFEFDNKAEKLSPDYKNIIYTTVMEGLTNSIKYGQAGKIYISIEINKSGVDIVLKDNGIGCDKIVKGNGFIGIEKRIFMTGGTVDYITELNKGFELRANIPMTLSVNS